LGCSIIGEKKILVQGNYHVIISSQIFAGVTTTEIMMAHVISQMVCVMIQMAVILTLSFWAFQVPCTGSFVTAVLLVGLQGFCGMCFGKENIIHICSYFLVHSVLLYH
jgi:hypothetical protein